MNGTKRAYDQAIVALSIGSYLYSQALMMISIFILFDGLFSRVKAHD